LDGYVARVAAAHHMPRMSQITEVTREIGAHRPHASFCDDAGLEVLADCLGIDPESIRLHSPAWSPGTKMLSFFGTLVSRNLMQFTYRRFSPQALSMSAHHRGLWQIRQLPICTETWEYLEEHCPNPSCRRRQLWRRTAGVELCDYCAEPLTRAQATPVPENLRNYLEMLIGLIHHDPEKRRVARRGLPPDLEDLSSGHLLELAFALAPVIDRRVAPLLADRSLNLDSSRNFVVPALAATWPFLAGWPGAIEQHVAEKLNIGGSRKDGSTCKAFYKVLCDHNDPRLSPAVQNLLSQLVERCRAARSRGVTIAKIAKLTCADRQTLLEMRKAGKLPSFLALDGHRLQVLVNQEAVAGMLAHNRPRLRLIHAAEMLGVPTYAIREMVHLGLVRAAPVPPGRGDYLQLAVARDSMQTLRDALSRSLTPANDAHPVSLVEVMRRIGGRPKPWARVIKAIIDGKLPARAADGEASIVQRIMIESGEVLSLQCFQEIESMNWSDCMVTKSDVAEIMNLSSPHFSRCSEFLLGPGPAFREISMDTAQIFARTYMSTGEVSCKLGLHRPAVSKLARSRGVKTEIPGLFRRAQAEQLIQRPVDS
jgi:hypothetical protein